MTNTSQFRVLVNGPRPPFEEVAHHLWGTSVDFDSDGDSKSPGDQQWTELTVERRGHPAERVDFDPVSEMPLVIKVASSTPGLARRAAEFLMDRTEGRFIE